MISTPAPKLVQEDDIVLQPRLERQGFLANLISYYHQNLQKLLFFNGIQWCKYVTKEIIKKLKVETIEWRFSTMLLNACL